jgi:hypothetical protein
MRAARSGRARPRRAVAAAAIAALLVLGGAVRSRGAAPAPAPPSPSVAQAVHPELPLPPEPLASVPPPAAAPVSGPASIAPMPTASEEALMQRLRAEVDADPQAALALADDGDRRFATTQYSDERAFLRIRALVHLGDIGIARDVARQFYERHPDSPLARSVFRLTGMRPAPVLGVPRDPAR